MTKRKRDDVGFDLETAIRSLHRAVLAAQALPANDFRASEPDSTASAHLHETNGACRAAPCRVGGLCHALYELTQFKLELAHGEALLDAAELTGQLRTKLTGKGPAYVAALRRVAALGKEHHEFATRRELEHESHVALCARPLEVLQSIRELVATLRAFEGELRDPMWTRELRQPSGQKRAHLLLRAVWQHLKWGGLTHREIFRLVPVKGIKPGDIDDLVAKRIAFGEARTYFPRELLNGGEPTTGRKKKAEAAIASKRRVKPERPSKTDSSA